jgi:hypothetical protein
MFSSSSSNGVLRQEAPPAKPRVGIQIATLEMERVTGVMLRVEQADLIGGNLPLGIKTGVIRNQEGDAVYASMKIILL